MPKLTRQLVENTPAPSAGELLIWDSDLPGFGVRITPKGVRSYIAQARVNHKTRRQTIGRHELLSTDAARRKAKTALGAMADGVDPTAKRKHDEAKAITLRDVAIEYCKTRRVRGGHALKDSTKAEINRHVVQTFATWADRPIVEITRDKVRRKFAELSARTPAQADQAFRQLRALLNFARAAYRTPDDAPILIENPVSILSHVRAWHGSGYRDKYIPPEHVGRWWRELTAVRTDPAITKSTRACADLAAILLLTGMRREEGRSLTWEHVDLENGSFALLDPKNRKPITLPLSFAAVEILKHRPRKTDYVFPGRSTGRVNDPRHVMRKVTDLAELEPIAPHDLRRTLVRIADELKIERWRIKMLIGHSLNSSGDVTLRHYTERSDRRFLRQEADAIAQWILDQAAAASSDNVITLAKRA